MDFGDFDDDDAGDDLVDLELVDPDAVAALQAEFDMIDDEFDRHRQKELAKDLVRRMNGAE